MMKPTTRSILTLVLAALLASPAFAQEAAPADPAAGAPVAAPAAETAPAPVEAAPAPAPEAAPVQQTTEVNVTAAPAPAPAPADEAPADDEDDKCLAGKLCFGPVLTLGLINPLGIGIHARYGEYLGFGFDYQFLPTIGGDVKVGINLITLDARVYPFAGAFFLSGGFAFQSASFEASATDMSTGASTKLTADLNIPSFKLGLGLMGHDGFVMGIDLALEIPFKSTDVKVKTTGTGDDVEKTSEDIKDAGDTFVSLLPVLFQINLIRIGYLF